MGLGLEKCCCFIPLRLGTFFIAIWFFVTYLFYSATGFLGVNAVLFYSSQTAKPWYYVSLLLAVFVCIAGLSGIAGSLFSSRRFAKFFSVLVWFNCLLSFVIYAVSLIIIAVQRQHAVDSCQVIGFVSIGNSQQQLFAPFHLSKSPYHSPVKFKGLLSENASSEAECQSKYKMFLILFAVLIFVIQIVQVYFGYVAAAYAKRLKNGARHHRLHAQQIKDFEESRYHMSTVY
ncbi:hypothetical protein BY458DRAFT_441552 [Sporodiniella umbellata]|nr:hypothetical protein BY458DRAFT_441552 [Sporodiniella umbellata]